MTAYSSHHDDVRSVLQQAIEDARAGRRDDAVRRLRQITADHPDNVDAWIWLGGTAPDAAEQRQALERALEIDPHNKRARQGLQWLRTTAPEVFEAAATTRRLPVVDDRAWQRANTDTPRGNTFDDLAERASAPTQAVDRSALIRQTDAPSPHDQETQAMPARQAMVDGAPYARRIEPAIHSRTPAPPPPLARTEAMHAAPQPYHAQPQRSTAANFGRWLLIMIWSAGLGAALALTGLAIFTLITDPPFLDTVASAPLDPFGLRFELGPEGRIGVVVALFALVLLDMVVVFGLVMRRQWAWRTALLVAVLIFIGAVVLVVLPFVLPGLNIPLSLDNSLVQIGLGLLGFTIVLLLLTLGSRNAFRRTNPDYEYYGR